MKNVMAYITVLIADQRYLTRKESMTQEVDGHRIGRLFQKAAFSTKGNGMEELKFHVVGVNRIWAMVSMRQETIVYHFSFSIESYTRNLFSIQYFQTDPCDAKWMLKS
jgi:hypothetical protein